jgi:glycosyltransferase involved in cell wall biosynthesis
MAGSPAHTPPSTGAEAGVGIAYDLQAYSFSPHGGIARIFDELFAVIEHGGSPWRAYLYLQHPLQRVPAVGRNVRFHPDGMAAHPLLRRFPLLRKLADPLLAPRRRRLNLRLFHPTFYPATHPFPSLPAIVNVYDLVHELIDRPDNMPDPSGFLAVKKRWIEQAARIICISEATANDLMSYYHVPRERIDVIHLGYSRTFRHKPETPPATKPFVLYVGSRQRYKNFHRLIAAYGRWNQRDAYDLYVVGYPASQEDRLSLDLAGNPAGVTFIGAPSDEELCTLYNQAAGFVYPSLKEGFGIPVLEAMACRCPMLLSDIPVFREVAGSLAHYMDPMDVDSMTGGLDRLVATARTQILPETQTRTTLDRFSWDRCSREILSVYEKVLA